MRLPEPDRGVSRRGSGGRAEGSGLAAATTTLAVHGKHERAPSWRQQPTNASSRRAGASPASRCRRSGARRTRGLACSGTSTPCTAKKSARASAHERAAAVDERLEQLDNELELAEHRLAAEIATTQEQFAGAIEAELNRWDAYLARMQAKAAAQAEARARARRGGDRRAAAAARLNRQSLAAVGTAAGENWRDAKTRVWPSSTT